MCGLTVDHLPLEVLWEVWLQYEQRYGIPSPFQTPQFAQCWLSHLGSDLIPRPLAAWNKDEIVGLFPLLQDPSSSTALLHMTGDIDTADYIDCLVPSEAEAVWLAVLAHLASAYRNGFIVRCQGVPAWSSTLSTLPALAHGFDLSLSMKVVDVSPILELPSSWEAYLASLGKHYRHELRRKLRRAEAAGRLELIAHDTPGDGIMDTFFLLMKASSEEKRAYLTPKRESFFRCLARQMAERSALRIYELRVDGRPTASILCFEIGSTVYLYNSGYDPAYAVLSPGYVTVALSIKDAIERGLKRYDFLRGRERYKYDLGGRQQEIREIQVEVPPAACKRLAELKRC